MPKVEMDRTVDLDRAGAALRLLHDMYDCDKDAHSLNEWAGLLNDNGFGDLAEALRRARPSSASVEWTPE